jgi:hypothetical protein
VARGLETIWKAELQKSAGMMLDTSLNVAIDAKEMRFE